MPNMSAVIPGTLSLLAHQGGWDELLLVAGPIVVIVAVLAVAKRRVDAIDHDAEERAAAPEG